MHISNPGSQRLRGKKILLVEENDQLYRALRESLTDAGGEVLGAIAFMPKGTGLVPLARIDVAIVDASYRSSHSVHLAREFTQRGIPCVFIAAEPSPALAGGECTFLSKPFTEEQLLDSVTSLISGPRPLAEFKDRSVLLVEDEYLVAMDMCLDLQRAGANVVGPAASVEDALDLLESASELDAAVLDIRLRDQDAFAIADVLGRRNIPFVFATGYDRALVPERYGHVPWCAKPLDLRVLATAMSDHRAA